MIFAKWSVHSKSIEVEVWQIKDQKFCHEQCQRGGVLVSTRWWIIKVVQVSFLAIIFAPSDCQMFHSLISPVVRTCNKLNYNESNNTLASATNCVSSTCYNTFDFRHLLPSRVQYHIAQVYSWYSRFTRAGFVYPQNYQLRPGVRHTYHVPAVPVICIIRHGVSQKIILFRYIKLGHG